MKAPTLRLQKVLAERGVASRRGAAGIIAAGRVKVDGQTVCEPGWRLDPESARVSVDGKTLAPAKTPPRAILLHKPRGCVCSRRGQGRPTIYDLLTSIPETLKPAGRLDADSEGLLILASDGKWIQALTHPRYGAGKTYRVDVEGTVDARILARLRAPMTLDGYPIRPVAVSLASRAGGKTRLEFILHEGRNRQIRSMCARVGLRIARLIRTEQAGIRLGNLPAGQWRTLTPREMAILQKQAAKAL